jgi:hypothetical protein
MVMIPGHTYVTMLSQLELFPDHESFVYSGNFARRSISAVKDGRRSARVSRARMSMLMSLADRISLPDVRTVIFSLQISAQTGPRFTPVSATKSISSRFPSASRLSMPGNWEKVSLSQRIAAPAGGPKGRPRKHNRCLWNA